MFTISTEQKEKINESFSENALKMMKKRYLVPLDDGGQETPVDMFERVARSIASVEKNYGKDEAAVDKVTADFFNIMSSKEYTPAGRTLTNSGGETPVVANCIVLPIHDSMESIFQTLKDAALLQQAGCGLGFDLSKMRPAYFSTKKSRGKASGPVSFLKVYDAAFGTIKQQGRHGANMAMMRIDHPDVLDFINCKKVEGEIRNFNITITITDAFMQALEDNPNQQWICNFKGTEMKPRNVLRHANGSVYDTEEVDITVKELYDKLVESAWTNGEPGIAFIDTINKLNPLPGLGPIGASNPCGEQFLHGYDVCNLGSLNLSAFVANGELNWDRLAFATRTATRLMDNVIDLFDYPVQEVTDMAQKNRRIGLGIMGFADTLFQLNIKYDSDQGTEMAEKIMGFIQDESHKMSQQLAKEKGTFLNYDKSVFAKEGIEMRNTALTTVAPTGSISMMFDVSSGIEPNFALAYIKQDKDGQQYNYLNKHFKIALDALNLSDEEKENVKEEIIKTGSVQHLTNLPEDFRKTFVVSMDISGDDHMKMQAAFQKHVDNSISKTINLPNSATKEEVAESFKNAWKLGCKSSTVYRDGSRSIQILNLGDAKDIVSTTEAPAAVSEEPVQVVEKETVQINDNEVVQPQESEKTAIAPRERPEVMAGKTYKIKTGYGKLYITINNDEKGEPFEIFATIGKSGGFFQEQSEAICRLSSMSLRSGVAADEIVDSLKGIRGPMPVFTEKGTILSLPDAIGQVLEEHVGAMKEVEEIIERPENQTALPFSGEKSIADFGFMPGCPDCGSPLTMSEGCISCKSCGFSRCS